MRTFAPLLLGFAVATLPLSDAEACRGPFPPPITQAEAFTRAEAVFLGTVTAITEGLPATYVPPPHLDLEARRKRLEGNGARTLGRTITFKVEQHWKGSGATVTLVELTPTNTCERAMDVVVGDRFLVYAAKSGNALTFPAGGFDGRAAFVRRAPRTGAPASALAQFEEALAELPKRATPR